LSLELSLRSQQEEFVNSSSLSITKDAVRFPKIALPTDSSVKKPMKPSGNALKDVNQLVLILTQRVNNLVENLNVNVLPELSVIAEETVCQETNAPLTTPLLLNVNLEKFLLFQIATIEFVNKPAQDKVTVTLTATNHSVSVPKVLSET